jgi:hypothetical protein
VGVAHHPVLEVDGGVEGQRSRHAGDRVDVEVAHPVGRGLVIERGRLREIVDRERPGVVDGRPSVVVEDDGQVLEAHGYREVGTTSGTVRSGKSDRVQPLQLPPTALHPPRWLIQPWAGTGQSAVSAPSRSRST